jgi:hypothetical protein
MNDLLNIAIALATIANSKPTAKPVSVYKLGLYLGDSPPYASRSMGTVDPDALIYSPDKHVFYIKGNNDVKTYKGRIFVRGKGCPHLKHWDDEIPIVAAGDPIRRRFK